MNHALPTSFTQSQGTHCASCDHSSLAVLPNTCNSQLGVASVTTTQMQQKNLLDCGRKF